MSVERPRSWAEIPIRKDGTLSRGVSSTLCAA